jgi:hypothetical protein
MRMRAARNTKTRQRTTMNPERNETSTNQACGVASFVIIEASIANG